jgi:hypothetical protein
VLCPFTRIDHRADRPDHVEDAGDASLVESMNVEPSADEIGGDVGLKIGERRDEVGLKRDDFVNVRRGEGTHTRLFAASLRRAHNIAEDPDDTVLRQPSALLRDRLPLRDRKFADSPLEGNGFEISVPRRTGSGFEASVGFGPTDSRRGHPSGRRPRQTDRAVSAAQGAATHPPK